MRGFAGGADGGPPGGEYQGVLLLKGERRKWPLAGSVLEVFTQA